MSEVLPLLFRIKTFRLDSLGEMDSFFPTSIYFAENEVREIGRFQEKEKRPVGKKIPTGRGNALFPLPQFYPILLSGIFR